MRSLLDQHANRDIPDHMDRLPRDVAQERLHHDIVRLLDEHIPRSNHHSMAINCSNSNNSNNCGSAAGNALGGESAACGTSGRPPKPKKRPKSVVAAARDTQQQQQQQQQRHLGSSVSNLDDLPSVSNGGSKRRATNSRKKKNDNAGSTNTVQSVDSVSTVSLTLSPANSHSLESPPTGKLHLHSIHSIHQIITSIHNRFTFNCDFNVDLYFKYYDLYD